MNVTIDLQTPVRLTPSGHNIAYSSVCAFSATSKYVLTADVGAVASVLDRETGRVVYPDIPNVNIERAWWHPTDDETLYYAGGACLYSRLLNTSTVTLIADLSKPTGARPAFPNLQVGNGTCDIRDDGWLALLSKEGQAFGAVDLNGCTPKNQESHVFGMSYSTAGITDANYADVTALDSVSKKHYLFVASIPARIYSIGPKGLQFEYELSADPYVYGKTPHSALGATVDGQQFLFWTRENQVQPHDAVCAFFNRGAVLMDDVTKLYTANLYGSGAHFGANGSGMMVHSLFDAYPNMPIDPLRNAIIVTEFGRDVRIIVQPHGSDALTDYWATPRANLSRDGKWVAYASNMGVKEPPSVYVVPTRGSQPIPPTLEQRVAELEKWRAEVAKASRP